jgi:tetrahydromethanopterin S-methyltransferase subunit G
MNIAAPSDLEKESLEAHAEICAIRYQQLDSRLNQVETKLENIHLELKNNNSGLIKVIIGAAGSIVTGILSTIVVLLLV